MSSIPANLEPNKLNTLVNYVTPEVFVYFADCATYDEAIAALKAVYIKKKNEVFAR